MDRHEAPCLRRLRMLLAGHETNNWRWRYSQFENLSGKKAARAVLDRRIRESQNRPIETVNYTVQHIVDALWRPYLDRKQVKPSTKRS
jgi:hypothetical protein